MFTIDRIEGKTERERRGRTRRKVLKAETFPKPGKALRSPVKTTIKSNQFQASLK